MKNKKVFVNLKYKPDYKNELVATFRIEASVPLETAAMFVAAESSIGTWTKVEFMDVALKRKIAAKIFFLDQKKKIAKIAYPIDLFERGSIPQLLSSIAGNIYSLKEMTHLRLLDIEFPRKYINDFPGPAFGIDGIRKYLKKPKGLILGSIIKPKLGLDAKQQAKLSYTLWINGVDLVKDDENLASMRFNNFHDRVKLVLAAKKKAEKVTGKKKIYSCNITAPYDQMIERAKLIKKYGGKCAMVDIISIGWAGIQAIRNQNLGLFLHGHRAGHSAFTRDEKHGMTMYVVAKLARLAGIDQLHTGTVVGKMDGTKQQVVPLNEFLKEDWDHVNNLREDWGKLKPVLPIASGGMHPGLLEGMVNVLGENLVINFGGGLHGHPQGAIAGARACYQARELVSKNTPFVEVKKDPEFAELNQALKFWR